MRYCYPFFHTNKEHIVSANGLEGTMAVPMGGGKFYKNKGKVFTASVSTEMSNM